MKNELSLAALPSDVRHDLRHQKGWWVVLSVLWYILWAVGVWRYWAGHPDFTPNYMFAPFCAAVLLLPLWIFRLRIVLFDRVWSGEIVRIKYRMMSDIPVFSEGLDRVERHETAVLYVRRTADGRMKKLACRRLCHAADRCYRVGDTVRHIPFVALPQNLSREPEEGRLCLVCGTLSRDSHDRCAACGRTIF